AMDRAVAPLREAQGVQGPAVVLVSEPGGQPAVPGVFPAPAGFGRNRGIPSQLHPLHAEPHAGLSQAPAGSGSRASGHMNPILSIVIPAYNEEQNVPLLHEAIAAVIDPHKIDAEIIFVDDGSKDGTWAAIEKRTAMDPR